MVNNILTSRVRWSIFQDRSHYSMWVVHPVDDVSVDSCRRFYFMEEKDADAFLSLISKSCHRKDGDYPYITSVEQLEASQ